MSRTRSLAQAQNTFRRSQGDLHRFNASDDIIVLHLINNDARAELAGMRRAGAPWRDHRGQPRSRGMA